MYSYTFCHCSSCLQENVTAGRYQSSHYTIYQSSHFYIFVLLNVDDRQNVMDIQEQKTEEENLRKTEGEKGEL